MTYYSTKLEKQVTFKNLKSKPKRKPRTNIIQLKEFIILLF